MMRGLRFVFAGSLGAATMVAVACGGDDKEAPVTYPTQGDGGSTSSSSGGGSTSSSSSGGTSKRSYCDALDALIDKETKCCSADDLAMKDNDLLFAKAFYQQFVCPAIDQAMARNRLAVDPNGSAACNAAVDAALAKLACPEPPSAENAGSAIGNPCLNFYAGLVSENGACRADHECMNGLTCVGWGAEVDGKCVKPPAIGQACGHASGDAGQGPYIELPFGTHPKCATGARCNDVEGKCEARAGLDQSCFSDEGCLENLKCHLGKCGSAGPSDVDGACIGDADCKDGLWCTCTSSLSCDGGAGTCKAKLPLDSACNAYRKQCGGKCISPDGGEEGTCKAWCGFQ